MLVKVISNKIRQTAKNIVKITLTPIANLIRRNPGLKRRAIAVLHKFPALDARIYKLFRQDSVTENHQPAGLADRLGRLPERGYVLYEIIKKPQKTESEALE